MVRKQKAASSLSADELLAGFPADVRDLTNQLREFIRSVVPDAVEKVYSGWRGFGYHEASAGFFCALFPQSDRVKIGFEHGASLPDPDRILEGSGRQVRYLVLRTGEPVPDASLKALLLRALHYQSTRR